MELEHLQILGDDVRRSAGLLVPQQLVVGLDDVGQLVSQIVLEKKYVNINTNILTFGMFNIQFYLLFCFGIREKRSNCISIVCSGTNIIYSSYLNLTKNANH